MTKRSKKDQQGLTASAGKKSRLHLSSSRSKISKKNPKKEIKGSGALLKNDWGDAVCPVCVECPHEAVLLLCASHKKGCRPYICDTSYEFSNCLNRYKEACPKTAELSCPLCRGKVTGWTVVKPAREFLNAKKRSCSQDNCSFSGKFEDLKNHVRLIHPLAKPKEVDPELEEEWKRMEEERERNDLMSTIRATTPGAMVVGDYVIENPNPTIPGQHSNLSESIRNMMNFILMGPGLADPASTSLNSRLLRREIHRNLRQTGTDNPDPAAPGLDENHLSARARALARLNNRLSLSRSVRRQRRRTQE
uniref:Uncharacterized protein n=1 Tax=Kalanchoe fedtschenkoi TaxID=63787 RepID=A0A7N0U0Q7_KALFE